MTTLPDAWHRVIAGTGWPGFSIAWVGEIESLVSNFYLSEAACTIVWADLSLRYTSMLLGCQVTNKQQQHCFGFGRRGGHFCCVCIIFLSSPWSSVPALGPPLSLNTDKFNICVSDGEVALKKNQQTNTKKKSQGIVQVRQLYSFYSLVQFLPTDMLSGSLSNTLSSKIIELFVNGAVCFYFQSQIGFYTATVCNNYSVFAEYVCQHGNAFLVAAAKFNAPIYAFKHHKHSCLRDGRLCFTLFMSLCAYICVFNSLVLFFCA